MEIYQSQPQVSPRSWGKKRKNRKRIFSPMDIFILHGQIQLKIQGTEFLKMGKVIFCALFTSIRNQPWTFAEGSMFRLDCLLKCSFFTHFCFARVSSRDGKSATKNWQGDKMGSEKVRESAQRRRYAEILQKNCIFSQRLHPTIRATNNIHV